MEELGNHIATARAAEIAHGDLSQDRMRGKYLMDDWRVSLDEYLKKDRQGADADLLSKRFRSVFLGGLCKCQETISKPREAKKTKKEEVRLE